MESKLDPTQCMGCCAVRNIAVVCTGFAGLRGEECALPLGLASLGGRFVRSAKGHCEPFRRLRDPSRQGWHAFTPRRACIAARWPILPTE